MRQALVLLLVLPAAALTAPRGDSLSTPGVWQSNFLTTAQSGSGCTKGAEFFHHWPQSDEDAHAHTRCKYAPSKEELDHYKSNPLDVAILAAYRHDANKSIEDMMPTRMIDAAVIAWKRYADHHGYAFYTGPTSEEFKEANCPRVNRRAPHWTKPCALIELLQKHKYVISVDAADTYVAMPKLRLEPLFKQVGLTEANTGKAIAIAEEWGSCAGQGHHMGGDVNTGVVLLKSTERTVQAMKDWYNEPIQCDKAAEDERCKRLVHSLGHWPFDQTAFHVVISADPRYEDLVTTIKPGCPFNSPFAEFLPHLVSGSHSGQHYHWQDRALIIKSAHNCSKEVLEQDDDYKRCALCDLIPPEPCCGEKGKAAFKGAWSKSCPKQFAERMAKAGILADKL